jgi:hypothetical protein
MLGDVVAGSCHGWRCGGVGAGEERRQPVGASASGSVVRPSAPRRPRGVDPVLLAPLASAPEPGPSAGRALGVEASQTAPATPLVRMSHAPNASLWPNRAAIVAGGVVPITGTGGTAAVVLGVAAVAASAVEFSVGAKAHNRCHVRSGAIGTSLGLITRGSWGGVTKGLGAISDRAVAGAGIYASGTRQPVYEMVSRTCR